MHPTSKNQRGRSVPQADRTDISPGPSSDPLAAQPARAPRPLSPKPVFAGPERVRGDRPTPDRVSSGKIGEIAFASAPVRQPLLATEALVLAPAQRAELEMAYGADLVASRLAFDVFPDAGALKRQLAHETKTEITLAEFEAIVPHPVLPGQHAIHVLQPRGAGDDDALAHHSLTRIMAGTSEAGVIRKSVDDSGNCISMHAIGRFDMPDGWSVEDRMTHHEGGMHKLRSRLSGPDGESGMVVRSFDGQTLHLDKAYKSTLPTRLAGVPGFDRAPSTINYLTARACRILGVNSGNLQQIKINRLQHRPTLAHLDWLRRRYPQQSLPALLDHSTWARTYIRETAGIVGHKTLPEPTIDLQGSQTWQQMHPQAMLRDWDYLGEETKRLVVEHLTGEKITCVDDPTLDWRDAAAAALEEYKSRRCAGLNPEQADTVKAEIDTLLKRRFAAIDRENLECRLRYDIPPASAPRDLNFDVTYRTVAAG